MLADGQTREDMWAKIAPGRSSAWCGLCCIAKRFGIIREAFWGEERRGCGTTVKLGRAAEVYELRSAARSNDYLQDIMDTIKVPPWPRCRQGMGDDEEAPSQVCDIACVVQYGNEVVILAARVMGPAADLGRGYLTRRLLSLVELEYGPAVWGCRTYGHRSGVAA